MKKIIALMLMFHGGYLCARQRIIFLISPPRCASTSCVRSWENRGDIAILHEISMKAFELERGSPAHAINKMYRADAPTTYQEVKDLIFSSAQEQDVLVKEISYSIIRLFNHFPELLSDPQIFCIFLLRDPYDALVSFYKKRQHVPLDQACDFGYRKCYELLQLLKEKALNKPLIIFAEDLADHAREIWSAVCAHVGMPFTERQLEWQAAGLKHSAFQAWHEMKSCKEFVYHWHGDALKSTHFGALTHYEKKCDFLGEPLFEQVNHVRLRPMYRQLYFASMPYYTLLSNEDEYFVLKKEDVLVT